MSSAWISKANIIVLNGNGPESRDSKRFKVSIVSLLTITLRWKQSKYPSMNEWMSKTFTFNEILFSL